MPYSLPSLSTCICLCTSAKFKYKMVSGDRQRTTLDLTILARGWTCLARRLANIMNLGHKGTTEMSRTWWPSLCRDLVRAYQSEGRYSSSLGKPQITSESKLGIVQRRQGLCSSKHKVTCSKAYRQFFVLKRTTVMFQETRILEQITFNKQQQPLVCAPIPSRTPEFPTWSDLSQLRRWLLPPTSCTWQTSTAAPSLCSSLSHSICLGDRRSCGPFTSTSCRERGMVRSGRSLAPTQGVFFYSC